MRKKEKKKAPPEDSSGPSGFRDSWEYRSGKLVLRIAAALFFVAYLLFAAPMSFNWALIRWERHYPPQEAGKQCAALLAGRESPETLRVWLANRKAGDASVIMPLLEPCIAKMNGLTFILFSDWMLRQKRYEEALFWRQYARFRVRYDALRCGSLDSIYEVTDYLNTFPRPEITRLLEEDPKRVPKSLRDVLDYDAKHPADDDPADFCRQVTSRSSISNNVHYMPVPKASWDGIRTTLRVVTIAAIEKLEEDEGTPPARRPAGKKGKAGK